MKSIKWFARWKLPFIQNSLSEGFDPAASFPTATLLRTMKRGDSKTLLRKRERVQLRQDDLR